jgi:hypothetical protein
MVMYSHLEIHRIQYARVTPSDIQASAVIDSIPEDWDALVICEDILL